MREPTRAILADGTKVDAYVYALAEAKRPRSSAALTRRAEGWHSAGCRAGGQKRTLGLGRRKRPSVGCVSRRGTTRRRSMTGLTTGCFATRR